MSKRLHKHVVFEFLLRAETPIAHHQEVFGNAAQVFRKEVAQSDGSFAKVPYVTGDTMRHGLREASFMTLLDATGMLESASLTESALRLGFAGGIISGGGAGATKLDEYREMVALYPPLGLLGGCAQNRAIPGKMFVEDATLVCTESWDLLPDWVHEVLGGREIHSCRAHVEETVRVRMDPSLVPAKRMLLTDGEQVKINGRLLASESASEANDAVEKRESKSTMLPRSYEEIKAGSLLYWRLTAKVQTEMEYDALRMMIVAFLADAVVGGKRGTGRGRIGVAKLKEGEAAVRESQPFRPREVHMVDPTALATQSGAVVVKHYQDNAERIRKMLDTVVA